MKKIIIATTLSLTIAMTALAQVFAPLNARAVNGTDPAQITINLGIPNSAARDTTERDFGQLFRARNLNLSVRIPQFAIGAIETSRLDKALETEMQTTVKGIAVNFKNAEFRAGYDVLNLEVKLEAGLKTGTYPMIMNLSNPLTKQQGSIAFSVVVRK